MTIKALYPNVRPALDLNFARTKALDPRITFTRPSTGTFVGGNGLVQTAASGVPRFDHNPTTGESLGLLVEEARTNLLTYSQSIGTGFDTTNLNSTLTQNAAVAPNGTSTATTWIENSGASLHELAVGATTGRRAYSIFAKEIAGSAKRYIALSLQYGGDVQGRIFDLSGDGLISSQILGPRTAHLEGTTGSIQKLANGWYRCTVTWSGADTSLNNVRLQIVNNFTGNSFDFFGRVSYTGDGTSGLLVWGAQLEAGSFPTSYIPTSGATATRVADVVSMTGTNFSSWYNQNEGTIFAQGITTNNSAYLYDFSISPADGSQRIYTIGSVSGLISASSNLQVSYTYSANRKTAFAFNSSGLAFGLNGAIFNNAVLLTSPSLIEAVAIGARFNNIGQAGLISRLTYYPTRLPDAQLQALTQ